MDKLSYALGLGIGQQLRSMLRGGDLNVDDFALAIKDVLGGAQPRFSSAEAQKIVNYYFSQLQDQLNAEKAVKSKQALAEGKAFLEQNAKKEGVVVTNSGLQYEVLKEGTGKRPKATDTVRCHYEGRLLDGSVFDSSYRRNQPADFGLSQVITGWTEGVQLMAEGAKYRFYIPYMLAYGEGGAGASIPPFATLIFDVELIKVL